MVMGDCAMERKVNVTVEGPLANLLDHLQGKRETEGGVNRQLIMGAIQNELASMYMGKKRKRLEIRVSGDRYICVQVSLWVFFNGRITQAKALVYDCLLGLCKKSCDSMTILKVGSNEEK